MSNLTQSHYPDDLSPLLNLSNQSPQFPAKTQECLDCLPVAPSMSGMPEPTKECLLVAPSMSGMREPAKECLPVQPSVGGLSEPTKEYLECLSQGSLSINVRNYANKLQICFKMIYSEIGFVGTFDLLPIFKHFLKCFVEQVSLVSKIDINSNVIIFGFITNMNVCITEMIFRHHSKPNVVVSNRNFSWFFSPYMLINPT